MSPPAAQNLPREAGPGAEPGTKQAQPPEPGRGRPWAVRPAPWAVRGGCAEPAMPERPAASSGLRRERSLEIKGAPRMDGWTATQSPGPCPGATTAGLCLKHFFPGGSPDCVPGWGPRWTRGSAPPLAHLTARPTPTQLPATSCPHAGQTLAGLGEAGRGHCQAHGPSWGPRELLAGGAPPRPCFPPRPCCPPQGPAAPPKDLLPPPTRPCCTAGHSLLSRGPSVDEEGWLLRAGRHRCLIKRYRLRGGSAFFLKETRF